MPVSAVRIRQIRPSDGPALERFYAALSDESRALRFFAPRRGISREESRGFCATDHAHREGFVAVAPDLGNGENIVGHVCVEPAERGAVELAVAVADAYQGLGIGRRLSVAAVNWARKRGFPAVTMTVLNHNAAMHSLVRALGLPTRTRPAGCDATAITAPLAPTAAERHAA